MATPVADIQINSDLIDNYLYVMDSPVTQDPDGRFMVMQNPKVLASGKGQASELLTVDGAGQLVHYVPNTSSNSGWSKTVVPDCTPPSYAERDEDTDPTILRLTGFYDGGGILNVLVYYATAQGTEPSCATWMQRSADGTWSNATAILSPNAKTALACTYQTDVYVDGNGQGYFYGVSAYVAGGEFFIAAYDANSNRIDVIYSYDLSDFLPALTEQAAFRMVAGADGDTMTVLWVATPKGGQNTNIYYQGATVTVGRRAPQFAWSNGNALKPGVLEPEVGIFTVADLIGLPGAAGADAVMLRNSKDVLYLISGYNTKAPTMTAMTGGTEQPSGAVATTVGEDATGALTLFIIEKQSTNLWYIQQAKAGGPFGTWVNLAGALTSIASPSSMAYGPELFAVDTTYDIYHKTRTLGDQVWALSKVAEPSPSTPDNDQPQNIPSYQLEVTALDDTGAPIANAIVYATADHPSTMVIKSLSYLVDSGAAVPIQTDGNGQATLTYHALDLKPPLFTLSSTSDGTGVSRWTQGDVVEVKAQETQPPPKTTTVTKQLAATTQQTLTDNGLIDPNYGSPQSAVQAIQAAAPFTDPTSFNGDGTVKSERFAVKHWTIDFTAPAGPQFRVLSDAEARQMRDNASELGSSGIFGDICHFFKNAWEKLETFSTSIENEILTIYLNGEQWVVQTVKQAGDALETVFTRIMQGLKDLYAILKDILNWLKMLFAWSDILNTHNVLRNAINGTLTNLENSATQANSDLDKWYGKLKTDVDNAFNELAGFGNQSFNQFVNNVQPSSDSSLLGLRAAQNNVLAGSGQKTTYKQHSSQCNYAHRHALTSHENNSVTTLNSAEAPAATVSMNSISSAFTASVDLDIFNKDAGELQKYFATPSTFFDNGIEDVCISGVKDLTDYVLGVADSILSAGVAQMDAAAIALKNDINATIHVPILSWIYKYEITGSINNPGDDLTILDLVCLVNAVPVTILFKVVNGKAPFTSSSADVIKQYGMPWPTALYSADVPSLLSDLGQVGDDLPDDLAQLMYDLGCCAVFIQLFGAIVDAIGDAVAAARAEAEETEPNALVTWLSRFSVGAEIVLYGINVPITQIQQKSKTPADVAVISSWAYAGIPVIIDTICVCSNDAQVKFEQKMNGPVLISVLYAVAEGCGIWTAAEMLKNEGEGYNGYQAAAAIVGNLSGCMKFMISFGETAYVILVPVDFFVAVADLLLNLLAWAEERPPSADRA